MAFVIVADQSVGPEINVHTVFIRVRGGGRRAAGLVDRFDGNFGGLAAPDNCASGAVKAKGHEAAGLEPGQKQPLAGNDRGRKSLGDRRFPGGQRVIEMDRRLVAGRGHARPVGSAKLTPGWGWGGRGQCRLRGEWRDQPEGQEKTKDG